MTVKGYEAAKDEVATMVYIRGLGEGITWANTAATKKLFCTPAKLALGVDNFVDTLNRQIDNLKHSWPQSKLEEMPIGALLLRGLIETFPCSSPK